MNDNLADRIAQAIFYREYSTYLNRNETWGSLDEDGKEEYRLDALFYRRYVTGWTASSE